ncbi:copper resistance system multicopper oxidase [Lichenicola cladoniae]|uniref:Copper resistance system multicopper oxidase n=1 Tax=Lichenicola cladoniae TaxID=1484109 RepID=A0A6M8HLI4_9PROT|nr:copper resistance system multicopper oxidase [Lichenicola cladoniae]QKE89202.1 copper resistance system multicopper oxidase [Lichenicola cladoniae]
MSRRRFVQGSILSGAALATLGGRAWGMAAANSAGVLSGKRFDLAIGSVPVNMTGRPAVATGVNGLTPGPVLHWRQGDTVVLNVRNTLAVPSSIHWHGIRSPANMDGVPALSFRGIMPGETFTYWIPLHQSGTYWYHSHSAFQEQTGLYGAIVVEPAAGYAQHFDRDHVVLLSDWSDSSPEEIVSNLKMQNDYYNFHERDAGTFLADAHRRGLGATIGDRLMWGGMRMSAADIADVTGATYTYLFNGAPPGANWTGLFRPGERVRLRFINGSSMSFFDVRIPGLTMTVVAADGNDVEPVPIDEFRIGVAETYDVIVEPTAEAYTIFAQSEDRTGFARGTLATRAGLVAPIPPMDPRPIRTMTDMGMGTMNMGGSMAGMDMSGGKPAPANSGTTGMADKRRMGGAMKASPEGQKLHVGVGVDNVAMDPINRLGEPGDGLSGNGRRVLTYNDLRATIAGADPRPPSREITLHLTGNMQRYMWGFDGKKFSQAEPIRLARGERVRFTLINDTMMEHPIHLHGLWSELENGQGDYRPYKHTVIVQPGGKLSYLVTADAPGMWAYHCHLLYHMELGMFRTVVVA